MALVGKTNDERMYNFFIAKGLTPEGVCGLMGNIYRESGLRPNNLQNTYSKKLGYTDEEYTAAVDNGTYTNFVRDSAGYGLAQWTYWTRKQNLLNYAKSKSVSIADEEMQYEFIYKELSESYKSVLSRLKCTKSVAEASDLILLHYERPADQSEKVQKERAAAGQVYYDKFVKEVSEMSENKILQKDNIPDEWAKEAVNWAVKNKILFGDENGNYKLHNNCTRQEMLIFLNRLYNLVK